MYQPSQETAAGYRDRLQSAVRATLETELVAIAIEVGALAVVHERPLSQRLTELTLDVVGPRLNERMVRQVVHHGSPSATAARAGLDAMERRMNARILAARPELAARMQEHAAARAHTDAGPLIAPVSG